MFELYAMNTQGLGCEVDEEKAFYWCQKAAAEGDTRAMCNLGGFYATGRYVPKDINTSLKWYKEAADFGNGKANASLGIMYALGTEVTQDEELASEYFEAAEECGFEWREMAERAGIDIADYEIDY